MTALCMHNTMFNNDNYGFTKLYENSIQADNYNNLIVEKLRTNNIAMKLR